jgi:hypothetical protein
MNKNDAVWNSKASSFHKIMNMLAKPIRIYMKGVNYIKVNYMNILKYHDKASS